MEYLQSLMEKMVAFNQGKICRGHRMIKLRLSLIIGRIG